MAATILRISTLNTRIGSNTLPLPCSLRTTTISGHQPWLLRLRLRHQPTFNAPSSATTTTATAAGFSTSARCAAAIEKKALSKKITLPKDPYLLSEKVVKFAKNGKLDDAITLVMEAPKTRQNEVVWNHLIQESSKLGKINQSWQLLNDMKKRGFEPSDRTFTILLNSLAINASSPNSVSRARALFQQIQDSEDTTPTIVHTNALLKVCARQSDYDALQQIYDDVLSKNKSHGRAGGAAEENAPDVITYSTLINAYARKGGDQGFQLAWKVWEDCLEAKARRGDDVDLDTRIVDAILLACREAKSPVFIKRGYKLVESLYGLPHSSSSSSSSSSSTSGSGSGSGSSATERSISPSKSLGLGPAPLRETIHPRTVELLLSLCSKLKDYNRSKHYYNLIRTTYPDFKPDPQLLSSLMHGQVANKEYDTAIATWDELDRLGLQHTPGTFKQGLDAAFKARNWPKTLEMYTAMRTLIDNNKKLNPNPDMRNLFNPIVRTQDAWTLVSTLKCAVKTNHLSEGLEILRRSRWTRVIQNPQYPFANADLANVAVKIYAGMLKSNKEALDGTTTTTTTTTPATAFTTSSSINGDNNGSEGDNNVSRELERQSREKERLTRELNDARALQTQMAKALEDHDARKAAQKEIEDTNRFRNRRSPSSSSSASAPAVASSTSTRYPSSGRSSRPRPFDDHHTNNDDAADNSSSSPSSTSRGGEGGWRKVSAEEYTESSRHQQKPWGTRRTTPTSQSSSSYSDRSYSDRRPQRSSRDRPATSSRRYQGDSSRAAGGDVDPFTTTQKFTRTIDDS
ncbi:hypothetical protein BGX23_004296 [Mortierella sp. AD031]|nr:hypothetical protein BGX23_004296 [Mortierella sp. AD031]